MNCSWTFIHLTNNVNFSGTIDEIVHELFFFHNKFLNSSWTFHELFMNFSQGSHKNVKTKFPDLSLTSNEISLTILSTTDCRAISYVNISDESRCLQFNAADVTLENNAKYKNSLKFTCALSYWWIPWQTFSIIDKNNSNFSWQSAV